MGVKRRGVNTYLVDSVLIKDVVRDYLVESHGQVDAAAMELVYQFVDELVRAYLRRYVMPRSICRVVYPVPEKVIQLLMPADAFKKIGASLHKKQASSQDPRTSEGTSSTSSFKPLGVVVHHGAASSTKQSNSSASSSSAERGPHRGRNGKKTPSPVRVERSTWNCDFVRSNGKENFFKRPGNRNPEFAVSPEGFVRTFDPGALGPSHDEAVDLYLWQNPDFVADADAKPLLEAAYHGSLGQCMNVIRRTKSCLYLRKIGNAERLCRRCSNIMLDE